MPFRLPFAEPVNVRIVSLALKLQDVGPDPNLDTQPVSTCRLAEVFVSGDLDVGTFSVQRDGRIGITNDGTRLLKPGRTPVDTFVVVAGPVDGLRSLGFSQPPVSSGFLSQHLLFVS